MPRTQINYPIRYEQLTSESSETPPINNVLGGPWNDPTLHVNWHAEKDGGGHVQVAFWADPAYLQFCATDPNEDRATSSVWSPVLTRTEINRLIRALRQARDQAYGRDE